MIQYRRDLWKIIPATGDIAEIGVAEANFSADMLNWTLPDGRPSERKVYMVDRWAHVAMAGDSNQPQAWHDANYAAAMKRVALFGDRAVILRGNSVDMAAHVPDRSLALVNFDADHSFEGLMADILAWVSKLIPGGIAAFHDYESPSYGVKQAVRNYCDFHGFEIHLLPEDWPEDAGAFFIVP